MPKESFYQFRRSTIRSSRRQRFKFLTRNWPTKWIQMGVLMGRSLSGVSSSVLPAITPFKRITVLQLSWAKRERVDVHWGVTFSPFVFNERNSTFRLCLFHRGVHSLLCGSHLLQQSHDSQTSRHETEQARCTHSVLRVQGVSLFLCIHRRSMNFNPCSICLDAFKEGDPISVLPCNHAFHYDCIKPWLGEANTCCPVCKRCPYKDKDIVDMFSMV